MKYRLEQGRCPVERTLNVLGNRWVALVIWHLLDGRKRFGELKDAVGDISSKTLTDRLRELEHSGFIRREMFMEILPRVEYELTERGHSLRSIFDAMAEWADNDARKLGETEKPMR